jgi:hypothetical protein
MIPIDLLTGEFVTTKLHHDDKIHSDFFMCWGDIWQKPGYGLAVGKREDSVLKVEMAMFTPRVHRHSG